MTKQSEAMDISSKDKPWQPASWQSREVTQQATYPDLMALQSALTELAGLPPLVTSWEILSSKDQIAQAHVL